MPRGFTLIEISIVLVIIGLIIGGVLVGRDLIKSAEIRKTISQKDKIETAANTFRLKYNCLPGDCSNATSFGFSGGNNNNDGIIYTWGNDTGQYWFWEHLYEANLYPDKPNGASPYEFAGDHSPNCPICNRFDASTVYGAGHNYQTGGWMVVDFEMLGELGCSTFASGGGMIPKQRVLGLHNWNLWATTGSFTVKVADAYAIDAKLDDGKPNTGKVISVMPYYYNGVGCTTPALWVSNVTTAGIYDITSTNPNYGGLDVWMAASF